MPQSSQAPASGFGRRYAIVGADNVGKTTICHRVVAELKSLGLSAGMAPEPSRSSLFLAAGRRGVLTQTDLFVKTVANELEAARQNAIVVCDRSVIDVLAYNEQFASGEGGHDAALLEAMAAFSHAYIPTYHAMIFLDWPSGDRVPDDPLRLGVAHQQQQIASSIDRHLACSNTRVMRIGDPAHSLQRVVELVLGDEEALEEESGAR